MIIMYHNVDDTAAFNTVSSIEFENQLKYLKDNYHIVTIDNYVSMLHQKNQTDDYVVITFDDGYVNFEEKALPLIERYSIPVTQFIPVDYIGKYNEWDNNVSNSIVLPILDNNRLKSLSNHQLITFGSHGMSHNSLRTLSVKEVIYELSESKKILAEIVSYQIKWFSYPYGQIYDYNHKIISIIKNIGYIAACSTRFGRKDSEASLYELHRIEVQPSDTLNDFITKCHKDFHVKQFIKEIMYRFHLYDPLKKNI
ncbi:polysaccharide deacetylase family protein [Candidatus Latescibacterota bacterium]